jgi:hypothetical protein
MTTGAVEEALTLLQNTRRSWAVARSNSKTASAIPDETAKKTKSTNLDNNLY